MLFFYVNEFDNGPLVICYTYALAGVRSFMTYVHTNYRNNMCCMIYDQFITLTINSCVAWYVVYYFNLAHTRQFYSGLRRTILLVKGKGPAEKGLMGCIN